MGELVTAHASGLRRKPAEGDAITLDDGRNVVVVNSNGRSRWMNVQQVVGSRRVGEVFLATYSMPETHDYERGETRHPMHTDPMCTCGEPKRSPVHGGR